VSRCSAPGRSRNPLTGGDCRPPGSSASGSSGTAGQDKDVTVNTDFQAGDLDLQAAGRPDVASSKFEHVPYTEAVAILEAAKRNWEFPVHWGADLQSEHERYLTEEKFKKPVIVTDYPKEIKAFYMRANDDGKTVRAMDVLAPRIGEIIGGSQREERHDVLLEKIRAQSLPEAAYWWYLELRKFGSAPHAGFGLGLERMLMYLTGMKNIRDVVPFPRTPGSAEF